MNVLFIAKFIEKNLNRFLASLPRLTHPLMSTRNEYCCRKWTSFGERYLEMCKDLNAAPLADVRAQSQRSILELSADRIKLDDWKILLKALKFDSSLHYVAVRSKISRNTVLEQMRTESEARICRRCPVLYTKYLMTLLTQSLARMMCCTKSLTSLLLSRIPVKPEFLSTLCEGVKKNQSLQHIALQHCPIFDDGCFELCKTLEGKPNITTLDLTNCGITDSSTPFIAQLIKIQSNARFAESWKYSLRYSDIDNDDLPGLRRITLNQNEGITNNGVKNIVQVLYDDIWIKAVDMQKCGVGDDGCNLVLDLISSNGELEIFDLRGNKMSAQSLCRLMDSLKRNLIMSNRKFKFRWMDEVQSITSSFSQLTLNSLNPTSTTSKPSSRGFLSTQRSESTIRSGLTDAPWRRNVKQKTIFTRNNRSIRNNYVARCRSLEPLSQLHCKASFSMESARPDSREDERAQSEINPAAKYKKDEITRNGFQNSNGTVIGVTDNQLQILNDFKYYTKELINSRRHNEAKLMENDAKAKEKREEETSNKETFKSVTNSTTLEKVKATQEQPQEFTVVKNSGRDYDKRGAGDGPIESYSLRARQLFNKMLHGSKSSGDAETRSRISLPNPSSSSLDNTVSQTVRALSIAHLPRTLKPS